MNYDSDIDMLIVFLEVEREVKRALTVEIRRALADMPVPKDIVVTDLNEISRRGDLVGTVLRPALREGKVLYERGAKALLDEEDVAPRLTCFHAQQAAERSIKAPLAFLQTQFPRSHDLELLVGLVPEGWWSREDSDELS